MKLRQIGLNQTEVILNLESSALADFNANYTILFSYQTPVACFVSGVGAFKTAKKWSVTTSKHINAWMRENVFVNPVEIDQSVLDSLTNGGK